MVENRIDVPRSFEETPWGIVSMIDKNFFLDNEGAFFASMLSELKQGSFFGMDLKWEDFDDLAYSECPDLVHLHRRLLNESGREQSLRDYLNGKPRLEVLYYVFPDDMVELVYVHLVPSDAGLRLLFVLVRNTPNVNEAVRMHAVDMVNLLKVVHPEATPYSHVLSKDNYNGVLACDPLLSTIMGKVAVRCTDFMMDVYQVDLNPGEVGPMYIWALPQSWELMSHYTSPREELDDYGRLHYSFEIDGFNAPVEVVTFFDPDNSTKRMVVVVPG